MFMVCVTFVLLLYDSMVSLGDGIDAVLGHQW
jgi:hypothetical protein